jgi:membrane glycosyltransferase
MLRAVWMEDEWAQATAHDFSTLVSGPVSAPVSGPVFESPWLPAETPLAMPRQVLSDPLDRPVALAKRPANLGERRMMLAGGTFLLTFAALIAPVILFANKGFDALEVVSLILLTILTTAISCWCCNAVAGLVVMLTGREQEDLAFAPHPAQPTTRTALLAPIYNEDAAAVFARLSAMDASLSRLGVSEAFDIFVLSDSNRAQQIGHERTAFQNFRLQTFSQAFYRRREANTEHKSGNIADWVRRFGGAYDFMIVLDADSYMAGETMLRLVDGMERNPGAGLIQTTPVIVGSTTLFARLSQFGVRLYGRVAAAGLAWWTGPEGSFWGHNAIIRTRAFAESAGLPVLPGEKPFGGNIMSHDVVEAALLRRAGWGVHVTAALDGSCEETPPTITDFMRRDHRWCQGNMQHLSLLRAKGLSPTSRLQLAMGCMAYLSSPLWLASLICGLAIQLQYPTDWGSFYYLLDPEFTPFMLATIFSGILLMGPKMLGAVLVLSRRRERRAFGGPIVIIKGMVAEIALSVVMAPILMVANTRSIALIQKGDDAGWTAQQRDTDGLSWKDAWRAMAWQVTAGVGFSVALAFRADLVSFFLPIVLPLLFAPALAVWTSRRSTGEAFAERGFLVTPEDEDRASSMPAVVSIHSERGVEQAALSVAV